MVAALSRGLNCTFCYSIIKGLPILYLEGLIHGEAYFRNFMVYPLKLIVLSPVEDIEVLSLYQYFFANNIDNQEKCCSLLRGQMQLELQCAVI